LSVNTLAVDSNTVVFDVCIIGAGLAGLATALALYERSRDLKIAIISPSSNDTQAFGSNQPGIASHPHFSKDHNLLSQWTTFSLPYNEATLHKAFVSNPNIALAKGRWQVAKSTSDAQDIQARINTFNSHIAARFQAQWQAEMGKFGALWLPSAWAISPRVLQKVWQAQFLSFGGVFCIGNARSLLIKGNVEVRFQNERSTDDRLFSKKAIICSPASLHALVGEEAMNFSLTNSLPLIQWPGQSTVETAPQRTAIFGKTTVQNESYAIPLDDVQWLVRDDAERSTQAFRGDRWHTPDRLPYVGHMFDTKAIDDSAMQIRKNDLLPLPEVSNVFLNTGHGTRGLLSGISGAAIVADLLLGANTSLPPALANAINPNRYVRRALRSYFANLQSREKPPASSDFTL
jgi:glycine/D-amino acid oxidase-like deaminating enzyme